MSKVNKPSIKNFKELIDVSIKIAKGREKGSLDDLKGEKVTINAIEVVKDKSTNDEYIAFTIEEDDEHFFFGGSVISDVLIKWVNYCESLGYDEFVPITGTIEEKKSKNNLKYNVFNVSED